MAFNPNDHLRQLRGKNGQTSDYLETKWRLVWLRSEHPNAIVETEHVLLDDQIAVFKATITLPGETMTTPGFVSNRGRATGYGSETPGDFKDYIEKAETKAVGRALAALGFGTQFAPELDEGERIVDSPVQWPSGNAPRNAQNGPGRTQTDQTRQDPAPASIPTPRPPQKAQQPLPPSEPQLRMAESMIRACHLSDEEAHIEARAIRAGVQRWDGLDRGEMSRFIDRLMAMRKEIEAQRLREEAEAALAGATPVSQPMPGMPEEPAHLRDTWSN